MKSIAAIVALSTSLLPLALAAPAATSTAPTTPTFITESGTSDRYNSTIDGPSELSRRDGCNADYPYNVADMNTLISMLQSDGQTDYNPGGWGQWKSHTYNTARICIYNNYLYENTHVSHWEDGWAASYNAGKCCTSGNPQCSGGSCTAHGDSGLKVIVNTQSSRNGC